MKYRCEYRYKREFKHAYHTWIVIARHLAMHLHVTDLGEENDPRYCGGIEQHWREPPNYMKDEAPSHDRCGVLEAPCWHEGSSMAATDHWIPHWLVDVNDHDRMFRLLEGEVNKRTEEEKNESP